MSGRRGSSGKPASDTRGRVRIAQRIEDLEPRRLQRYGGGFGVGERMERAVEAIATA